MHTEAGNARAMASGPDIGGYIVAARICSYE